MAIWLRAREKFADNRFQLLFIYIDTVHDTENLTFSADDRADNPHIVTRPSAYVRADNQRIPHRQSADSVRNN